MGTTLTVIAVLVALAAVHIPLGNKLAAVYSDTRHTRLERLVYRTGGVDPDSRQAWGAYARTLLALSAVSILFTYLLLRVQPHLPFATGHSAVSPALAFNTAVSFATNTSWQSYAGESTLGHTALVAALGVQAFVSAAVGLAAAVALIRGLAGRGTSGLGNAWVDLTRSVTRVLLPLAILGGLVLLALGVVQTWHAPALVPTLAGASVHLPTGPIAAWEPIKLLSGDGGGAFNVGSAHPFENPSAASNFVETILMLLIPSALPRTYGRLVGHQRQGWMLAGVVAILLAASLGGTAVAQAHHGGTVPTAVSSASEGTETRIGVGGTAVFAGAAVSSADGAGDGSYDSFTASGGGVLVATLMLGEVSPGGTGSGLYGLLMAVILAVFIAGLMVGRTPEYLGKRVGRREITFASLYAISLPLTLLVSAGLAISVNPGRGGIGNSGAHGLSEVVYAMASTANSNGSAFSGLTATNSFYLITLSVVMAIGRYLPLIFVLGLAGAFARQRIRPAGRGTLPTDTPLFGVLVGSVVLLVTLLSFLPALALGPLAEATF